MDEYTDNKLRMCIYDTATDLLKDGEITQERWETVVSMLITGEPPKYISFPPVGDDGD